MNIEEKIKRMAEQRILDVRKLTKVGDSYFLRIPKSWITWHCVEIEGDYYFRLEVDGDRLIFSPINLDDIEAVSIKEKK